MNQTLPSDPKTAVVPCPKCGKPLTDPAGLGWCQKCGYCKSLGDAGPKVEEPATKPANTLTATGSAIGQTPKWFWVMLLGVAFVVGATFAGGKYLTLSPFERALLTSVQIGAGVLLMIAGQFIGLMKIAPEESTLGFWDAVFPFRLYGLIFKRLPATRLTIYLGVWGMTAAIAAPSLVGGLGHWFSYLPNSKNPPPVVQKAKK